MEQEVFCGILHSPCGGADLPGACFYLEAEQKGGPDCRRHLAWKDSGGAAPCRRSIFDLCGISLLGQRGAGRNWRRRICPCRLLDALAGVDGSALRAKTAEKQPAVPISKIPAGKGCRFGHTEKAGKAVSPAPPDFPRDTGAAALVHLYVEKKLHPGPDCGNSRPDRNPPLSGAQPERTCGGYRRPA